MLTQEAALNQAVIPHAGIKARSTIRAINIGIAQTGIVSIKIMYAYCIMRFTLSSNFSLDSNITVSSIYIKASFIKCLA